jgi:hypothetical protein
MISTNLRIVAIVASAGLLVYIVDLVRRRRLKEEYTALWVIVAVVLLVLASWGGLLHGITHAIGAVSESSTLYLFGLLFVILLLLNFSVRVSMLERRLTALVQEIALLSGDRLNGQAQAAGAPPLREAPPTRGMAAPGNEVADDAGP